jgi:hypothetical protein
VSEAASRSREVNRRCGRPCLTLLAGLILLTVPGCAGTGELTRARAAQMIAGSQAFGAPDSLPLKKETGWNLKPLSADETETEARAHAADAYYQAYPEMDVLRRLGLMDVRVVTRKSPGENYGVWSFDVEPFLTRKGSELASGGREAQGAPSVRLAGRELVEVTGITKTGNQTAQAEYTGKEVPTAAGRAFVPGSQESESLPATLRQALGERNLTKDFDKVRRGRAVFQLYDDGWRLLSAQ